MTTTITVTIRLAALHHWPSASAGRAYLGTPHRHVFVVRATCPVLHDDREIEFHDLQHTLDTLLLRLTLPDPASGLPDFGGRSCEHIAKALVAGLRMTYPTPRQWTVAVWEDDECGATVVADPLPSEA